MAWNIGPLNVLLGLKGASKFKKDAKGASSALSDIASKAKAAAGAYLGVQGAMKALDLGRQAAQFEDAARIFRAAGGDLNKLRDDVRGMVSDFELVKKANLARTMGINADAFGKLSQAAIAASKATGESVDFMLDSIVKGVSRGSPMILDNLGITISLGEANEAYAKQLGKSVKELTKADQAQAVLNATLKATGPIIDTAASAGADAAEIYAKAAASVDNLAIKFGQVLMPALATILPKLIEIGEWISYIFTGTTPEMQAADAAAKVADRVSVLKDELEGLRGTLKALEAVKASSPGLVGNFVKANVLGGDKLTAEQGEARLRAQVAAKEMELEIARKEANKALNQKGGAASAPTGGGGGGGGGKKRDPEDWDPRLKMWKTEVDSGAKATAGFVRGIEEALAYFYALSGTVNVLDADLSKAGAAARDVAGGDELRKKAAEKAAKAATGFFDAVDAAKKKADEAAAALRASMLTAAQAIAGGRVGATYGQKAGQEIGEAIGSMIPGGGVIGGVVGQVIGSAAGETLDEIFNAVGVLTPAFDALGEILGGLRPVFAALRQTVGIVAQAFKVGLAPLVALWGQAGAKFLYMLNGLLLALSPLIPLVIHLVAAFGGFTVIMSAIDLLGSAMLLGAGVVRSAVGAWINLVNNVIDFANLWTAQIRSVEMFGQKPFEEFGVMIPKLNGELGDYTALIEDEIEAREETIETLREFNEELSNVPMGIRRFRRLQFNAAGAGIDSLGSRPLQANSFATMVPFNV